MKRPVPILLLFLTGCSSGPPRPPIEVKVPVAVPCRVSLPMAPAFAVDALPLDANIEQQMKSLRAERRQRIGYERQLLAALVACR